MQKKIILAIAAITLISSIFVFITRNKISDKTGYYIVISSYNDKLEFLRDYKSLSRKKINSFGEKHIYYGQVIYYLYNIERFNNYKSAEDALPEIKKITDEIIDPPGNPFIKPEPVLPLSMKILIEEEKTDFGTEFIFRKPQPSYPYKIIAEKKGAHTGRFKKNTGERGTLEIIDTVPQSGLIPSGSPILVFLNGQIHLPSLIKNIYLKSGRKILPGIIRVFDYTPGKSALSITPADIKKTGDVTLTISGRVKDQFGNGIKNLLSLNFSYSKRNSGYRNSISFENNESLNSAGDVKILNGIPEVMPALEGEHFLALSNSDYIVSDKKSVSGKTGYYSLSTNTLKKINFSYNFISSEFNEYSSNQYGDIAILVAASKNYQKSWIISSVYSVGMLNTSLRYRAFCGLPDKGDSYAGMTGWKEFIASKGPLKGPVTLTFIITDIGDPEISSILLLDRIEFK